jgi:mRNA-degrading endonuclease RelE of RelBE toxin-antitoxin system
MKVIQSGLFARKAKKLNKQEKLILDDQIRILLTNPSAGDEKKGDLKGIHVHKFKLVTTQYLLAYRYSDDVLELIMLGPHENYYRDLKLYSK